MEVEQDAPRGKRNDDEDWEEDEEEDEDCEVDSGGPSDSAPNFADGIRFKPDASDAVTAQALVQAFKKDAESRLSFCRPIGEINYGRFEEELEVTLRRARAEGLVAADQAAVMTGEAMAKELLGSGYLVEHTPLGSYSLGNASLMAQVSSWVLGENMDLTNELLRIGQSKYDLQSAPYVNRTDGGTVFTFEVLQ